MTSSAAEHGMGGVECQGGRTVRGGVFPWAAIHGAVHTRQQAPRETPGERGLADPLGSGDQPGVVHPAQTAGVQQGAFRGVMAKQARIGARIAGTRVMGGRLMGARLVGWGGVGCHDAAS